MFKGPAPTSTVNGLVAVWPLTNHRHTKQILYKLDYRLQIKIDLEKALNYSHPTHPPSKAQHRSHPAPRSPGARPCASCPQAPTSVPWLCASCVPVCVLDEAAGERRWVEKGEEPSKVCSQPSNKSSPSLDLNISGKILPIYFKKKNDYTFYCNINTYGGMNICRFLFFYCFFSQTNYFTPRQRSRSKLTGAVTLSLLTGSNRILAVLLSPTLHQKGEVGSKETGVYPVNTMGKNAGKCLVNLPSSRRP